MCEALLKTQTAGSKWAKSVPEDNDGQVHHVRWDASQLAASKEQSRSARMPCTLLNSKERAAKQGAGKYASAAL